MTNHFEKHLRFGQQGENVVRRWLETHEYFITPTSSIIDGGNRSPALVRSVSGERVILPDFQAALRGASRWVEVKTKTKDVFYNRSQEHRQGIEERLFNDYMFVESESGIPGYLAFLVVTPAPIKLRIGTLKLLNQHKRPGVMEEKPHVFFPIDIFEVHEVTDTDLVLLAPAPQPANVQHVWERPAPTINEQQEYFDFPERKRTA